MSTITTNKSNSSLNTKSALAPRSTAGNAVKSTSNHPAKSNRTPAASNSSSTNDNNPFPALSEKIRDGKTHIQLLDEESFQVKQQMVKMWNVLNHLTGYMVFRMNQIHTDYHDVGEEVTCNGIDELPNTITAGTGLLSTVVAQMGISDQCSVSAVEAIEHLDSCITTLEVRKRNILAKVEETRISLEAAEIDLPSMKSALQEISETHNPNTIAPGNMNNLRTPNNNRLRINNNNVRKAVAIATNLNSTTPAIINTDLNLNTGNGISSRVNKSSSKNGNLPVKAAASINVFDNSTAGGITTTNVANARAVASGKVGNRFARFSGRVAVSDDDDSAVVSPLANHIPPRTSIGFQHATPEHREEEEAEEDVSGHNDSGINTPYEEFSEDEGSEHHEDGNYYEEEEVEDGSALNSADEQEFSRNSQHSDHED